MRFDRLLLGLGIAHAVAAAIFLVLMRVSAVPILGVHPALKPFKFAISIGLFLATMSVLVPTLTVSDTTRRTLAYAIAFTMSGELVLIAVQALRGQCSHFNLGTPVDAAITRVMMLGVVAFVVAMVVITAIAIARPLARSALDATAWRAALIIFMFSVVSGAAMGGRGAHTVGASDGGPGMAVTNWSATHGDLRVSHFFALHALQILPVVALVAARLPSVTRWPLLLAGIAANAVFAAWALLQALSGRPLL